MDTEHLRTFDFVVREGSFSRAGWEMDVAQPTVSGRIQALEQEVGGALFARRGRSVALTPLGESFLPYVRRTLAVLAEGIEAARQTQDGRRGKLAIGVSESLAGPFLSPCLARFHAAYPEVELAVSSGQGRHVIDLLHDGLAELGLLTHCPNAAADDLVPLLSFQEPLVFVLPSRHPLAARETITLTEIEQHAQPFLSLSWWSLPKATAAVFDALTPRVAAMPLQTARHLLRLGIGSALFPEAMAADEIAAGHLVSVPVAGLPALSREFALARHSRPGPLSAPAANFMALLRETAGAARQS